MAFTVTHRAVKPDYIVAKPVTGDDRSFRRSLRGCLWGDLTIDLTC